MGNSWVDRASDLLGRIAAWLFCATGGMILWEVTARYIFSAPTTWAEELSRMFLLWGTFAAMATVLRQRQMIRITMLISAMGPGARRLAEAFSLLFIAGFAGVAAWYGGSIAFDSFERGRTTGTLLNIPNWWTEAVIPVAFSLLLLQCIAELIKLLHGEDLPSVDHHETGP